MNRASFHFAAELNIFLPPSQQGRIFEQRFDNGQSVKHLIEALGVPHTEVGKILVNEKPTGFDYLVKDGDHVQVTAANAENGSQPPKLHFVLDNHLGRLASHLRMLGFDVLYRNDYQDETLAQIADEQNRILLTRDRRLLMRRAVRYGYCLRSLNTDQQLIEVMDRFDLYGKITPFQRCLRCNTPLKPVAKQEIEDRLEPKTRLYFDEFHICPACQQIYWKGSHYDRMQTLIQRVINNPHSTPSEM